MPLSGVPWMVDGAVHSARTGRRLANLATGGKEGVSGPSDLKVTAGTGSSVNIAPGGYAALNRYPNQINQTYTGAAESTTNVPVNTVGGAARSDAILLRIDDPEYGGTIPADRDNGPYEKYEVKYGIPSTAIEAADLALAYPAIMLARVDRPANATTTMPGNIVDCRQLVRPRYDSQILMNQPEGGTPGDVLTQSAFRRFPNGFNPTVQVPSWATHVAIVSELSGMGAVSGSAVGSLRNVLSDGTNSVVGSSVGYDTTSVTDGNRVNALIAASAVIPSGMRGKTANLYIDGLRSSGPGVIRVQAGTTVLHRIEFFERIL